MGTALGDEPGAMGIGPDAYDDRLEPALTISQVLAKFEHLVPGETGGEVVVAKGQV